jgi:hypothetical protein
MKNLERPKLDDYQTADYKIPLRLIIDKYTRDWNRWADNVENKRKIMKKGKRTKIECPYCQEGLVVEIDGKLFCEDCTNEIKK